MLLDAVVSAMSAMSAMFLSFGVSGAKVFLPGCHGLGMTLKESYRIPRCFAGNMNNMNE